ncbi:DNA repair helicase [Corynascus novoguineensis]|uniref:DNA 3'-5' helicase n=1 Tax=Corynascus novoguineensis TaxID=1126955 RepID=A0AAN7HLL3_9PEZI|nr:DNA repair helicase [Corynascus novoguineensis]
MGWPRDPRGSDDLDETADVPDELSKLIDKNAQKFDISDFPYTLTPGITDMASRYFESAQKRDFTALPLKPDHENLPLWIDGWGKIILENLHWQATRVQDFLITVAEPTSRPTFMHEYKLTIHSLYAAVSVGLSTKDIVNTLERFSKNGLPPNIAEFITEGGKSYGKVKLVLRNTKYFLETTDRALLQRLLRDPEISACRVQGAEATRTTAPTMAGLTIAGTKKAAGLREAAGLDPRKSVSQTSGHGGTAEDMYGMLNDDNDDDGDNADITHAFEIKDDKVSTVAARCLALQYPALEEYDFRNDNVNPHLEIDLRPGTQIRPYQERSLSKMFGNGRAKSGIIVLPCGAGKTLVGITAACTIRKGIVVLATGSMSAIQWRNEFIKWTNIDPRSISLFSSDQKTAFTGSTGVIVTTYSMVTNTRNRAHDSAKMMDFLASREWGLMLLDEVHVVPAQMFRKVIGSIKAHSKLGLTATLLREDKKIDDLNYLIGPKLYEANWMELSQQGHIARVQCAEVWCPMPTEFYEQYLTASARSRPLFCAMNPRKFQACQYLIKYHETRGDKIIVFSDNVYALEVYAKKLMKPFLYGGTSISERQEVLDYFRNSPDCSTLFLSKIGDTSLDLPEATEAQRLGRVLRVKRRNEEGFNAFFYSLVSKDTVEMVYSAKRQVFLVDQGYAFRVITQLKNIEHTPDLAFATPEARCELLQKVLIESKSSSWKEEEEKEAAGLVADGNMFYSRGGKPARKRAPGPRRTAGTLTDLSGGQDMAYIEQNESVNKQIKAKKKTSQSDFFRAITREKERQRKS